MRRWNKKQGMLAPIYRKKLSAQEKFTFSFVRNVCSHIFIIVLFASAKGIGCTHEQYGKILCSYNVLASNLKTSKVDHEN